MKDLSKINMEQDLRKYFGFDAFRPGQKAAIRTLMEDRRVLCIQPTGYGKSLLYQLPSLWTDGLTLVISPLLALMRDQIRHLNERFGIPAASINSDQTAEENAAAQRSASQGRIRILFVAPEKLDNLETYEFLLGLNVGLLVVDEAHCISTWGHDFRPSYRQIVNAVRSFEEKTPHLRVLGLTATANQRTEADIARQLTDPAGNPLKILRTGMDRPNISLWVIPVQGTAQKLEVLEKLVREAEGAGILYCATREGTEVISEYLTEKNLDVVSYHAGYDSERKRELQQAFMEGTRKAIAATNALGMGIDKPDIRFIVHTDIPGSVTAYYQEVGRAGRDGLPARGILLFDERDRRIQDHFIRSALPSLEDFRTVYANIRPDEKNALPGLFAVKVRTGLHPTRVNLILAELTEQGLIKKKLVSRKQVYCRTEKKTAPDLTRYTNQNSVRKTELESMLNYGRGEAGCLMQSLRVALGDDHAEPCGRCSQCRPDVFPSDFAASFTGDAARWLAERDVPISATKIPKMSQGFSLLNGDLRAPLFVQFMRQRAENSKGKSFPQLPPDLEKLLLRKLEFLRKRHEFGAVVLLPSRTWMQREFTGNAASRMIGIPVYFDLLSWKEMPAHRQGELLNNDQRRENVRDKMHITHQLPNISGHGVLLLDDYIGSGATLKEAVRVLRRQAGVSGEIVPLTMARVRWRLGARGMI
ncbi:RecQ family ATP-dependent DNA helicase [Desulfonema magnum]|uniref:DNA 3'-5' helicase n=1 Tax=Desulfonema magnum TaxID=45655 RepID=A0A975BX12_9BACT|nr:RecQ family ATP-dependent DNA helicase [Desulfonema magnum]QTA93349.1 Putative ATP-dependent DNA helicase [Desulfonema magnum]